MSIGVNRIEDEKLFHVTKNGVTLVTPEMLGQAFHQFR
jgi:glucose-1-phosphate adenylyltransferase